MSITAAAGERSLLSADSRYSVSADIGGTFTDVVSLDRETGVVIVGKSPTTALRPTDGVMNALVEMKVELAATDQFFHGTTLGVNTLLERRGARVGLLASKGFRDLLEIGRASWPPYRLTWHRPAPIVPRALTREVPGRILVDGTVLEELDVEAACRAARALQDEGVEAIAICFINGYIHPRHERQAADAIREAGIELPLVVSHEVSRRYGEHERALTAVGEAYIRPKMRAYFDGLREGVEAASFRGRLFITSSDAGVMGVEEARQRTLRTLVSGCASGIAGAATVGKAQGWPNMIAIDMGGTSFDAGVVRDGAAAMSPKSEVAGFEFLIPMVELATIGAGGGSIAWIDSVGGLAVGPRSAGAEPGPACYGRGGEEATFTDAALLTGLLPEQLLGGGMKLLRERAQEAVTETVAKPLALDTIEAASGIVALVEAKMARTIEEITIGRGADPRDHILFAYGGGGPLVAAALASELAIPTVVVPPHPGVFSAWGMQTLDIVHDFSSTVVKELPRDAATRLEIPELEALAASAHETLEREHVAIERRLLLPSLELRYDGQEHSLEIPIANPADLTSAYVRDHFTAAHERAYGFTLDDAIEMVACRLRAVGLLTKPRLGRAEGQNNATARAASVGERLVTHRSSGTRAAVWPVFQRTILQPGTHLDGPAIIEEQTSTTLVLPGWSATVDGSGNLVLRH